MSGHKAALRLRYRIVTRAGDPCRFPDGLAGLSSSVTEALGMATAEPPTSRSGAEADRGPTEPLG